MLAGAANAAEGYPKELYPVRLPRDRLYRNGCTLEDCTLMLRTQMECTKDVIQHSLWMESKMMEV